MKRLAAFLLAATMLLALTLAANGDFVPWGAADGSEFAARDDALGDRWKDSGPWLVLLLLPLALAGFRRGLFFMLPLLLANGLMLPASAQAGWVDRNPGHDAASQDPEPESSEKPVGEPGPAPQVDPTVDIHLLDPIAERAAREHLADAGTALGIDGDAVGERPPGVDRHLPGAERGRRLPHECGNSSGVRALPGGMRPGKDLGAGPRPRRRWRLRGPRRAPSASSRPRCRRGT